MSHKNKNFKNPKLFPVFSSSLASVSHSGLLHLLSPEEQRDGQRLWSAHPSLSAAASSSPFRLHGGLPGLGITLIPHSWAGSALSGTHLGLAVPSMGQPQLPSQSSGHTQPCPGTLRPGLGFFFSLLVGLFTVNVIVLNSTYMSCTISPSSILYLKNFSKTTFKDKIH